MTISFRLLISVFVFVASMYWLLNNGDSIGFWVGVGLTGSLSTLLDSSCEYFKK